MPSYNDLIYLPVEKKQGNSLAFYGSMTSGIPFSGIRTRPDAVTSYDNWYFAHSGKFRTQIFVSSSSGA